MSECWLMSDEITDPQAPNKRTPNVPVNIKTLNALGVLYRRLDLSEVLFNNPDKLDAEIAALKQELGYAGHDIVCMSPEKYPEGPAAFAKQLQVFFAEHIHEDDEVRLMLRGAGYFDVRDANESWVRIYVKAGDFLVLPAGISHRFTLDHTQYTETLRLFKEYPKWIAIPRPFEENEVRRRYVEFIRGAKL